MIRCWQVTELSETTRGSGGFGSTGVAPPAPAESPAENGTKKCKVTQRFTAGWTVLAFGNFMVASLKVPEDKLGQL